MVEGRQSNASKMEINQGLENGENMNTDKGKKGKQRNTLPFRNSKTIEHTN